MIDLANYRIQGTFTVEDCDDNSTERILGLFANALQENLPDSGIKAKILPEEFKLDSNARSLGGVLGFAAKLAQKATPGYAFVDASDPAQKEILYKIFFVASQIRDTVSIDAYALTNFAIYLDSRNPKTRQLGEYGERLFTKAGQFIGETFNETTFY